MSLMLFHQNTKKALRIVMWVVGILIIVSMIATLFPSAMTL